MMAIRDRKTGKPLKLQSEGLECRACGCRHFIQLGPIRQCRHCGKQIRVRIQPPNPSEADQITVMWPKTFCPSCGSDKTRVTSSRAPMRHHKCDGCGHCFKSME